MFHNAGSRLFRLIGKGIAALALAAAAIVSTAGGGNAQEKVLTVGNPLAPLSLDPAMSSNGRNATWLLPAYEPLVRTLADGSFEAGLATAWTVAPDNKFVTFTIRQGARFSDGEAVNAAAVKKSIDYFRAKKGPFSVNLATVEAIEVTAPDVLKLSLGTPNPNIVSIFNAMYNAGFIISPKAVDNPQSLLTGTFGAGPYKLDMAQSISGKVYTYIPNEFYYDKSRVKWDKLVISVFEDQNSAVQAMKAGQLKLLVSDPLTANANAASLPANIRVVSDPVQWAGIVLLDRDGKINPALKDLRVRQALNLGIDRALVAQALLGRFGEATSQIQTRGFMGYDAENEKVYPHDPARAKALLAEAGYPNGLEVKVGVINNTLNNMLFSAYQGQLGEIGVTLTQIEWPNTGARQEALKNKTIESLVWNINGDVPNIARFLPISANGAMNPYHSEDPELTRLMDEASRLPIGEAEAAWKKVYRRVVDLAWFVPVAAIHVAYLATDEVIVPQVGQTLIIDLAHVMPAK